MDYPPNSDKSKDPPEPPKRVERVTSEEPITRKPPLRKQFTRVFIGGDAKTTVQYMVFEVMIPAARDMVVDAGARGLERLIFGESRSGSRRPQSGTSGYFNYNAVTTGPRQSAPQRAISRRARSQHDFDEIVLQSRPDAEQVIERMYDVVERYEAVTVADLYELVGLRPQHTDTQWGWTDLRGAGVTRVRNGYLLDLPETQPLD